MGTHAESYTATYKRSASTALAGTHHAIGADPRARRVRFPSLAPLALSMVKFGDTKPDGLGYINTADDDLMHHQYRLSVLQWSSQASLISRRKEARLRAQAWRFEQTFEARAEQHFGSRLVEYERNMAERTW